MKAAVLVTDGEQRGTLAVVRSLGRAGHRVYVCAGRRGSLAGSSRYAADSAVVANPFAEPGRFVEDIQSLIRRWSVDVVIPMTDAALETLLPVRDQLGEVVIPCADIDSYRALSDKALVSEAARQVGIAIPPQRRVERREDLSSAANGLRFPLVLKPSLSVRTRGGQLAKLDVSHVADLEQLALRSRQLPDAAFPLLVQERITGAGIGIFLLTWDEQTLAVFSHRRLREKPPAGGVSVYAASIAPDPGLVRQCEELVRRFRWRGVLMVELKVDDRTGVPYLMEVNARFWGTLQLAIDCGVDFPVLLITAALGFGASPVREFRIGARLRWWWGDVDHLVTRLIRSRRKLSLPPSAPGRFAALWSFAATTLRGEADAVYRSDDPRPFLRETIDWLRRR